MILLLERDALAYEIALEQGLHFQPPVPVDQPLPPLRLGFGGLAGDLLPLILEEYFNPLELRQLFALLPPEGQQALRGLFVNLVFPPQALPPLDREEFQRVIQVFRNWGPEAIQNPRLQANFMRLLGAIEIAAQQRARHLQPFFSTLFVWIHGEAHRFFMGAAERMRRVDFHLLRGALYQAYLAIKLLLRLTVVIVYFAYFLYCYQRNNALASLQLKPPLSFEILISSGIKALEDVGGVAAFLLVLWAINLTFPNRDRVNNHLPMMPFRAAHVRLGGANPNNGAERLLEAEEALEM